MWSSSCGLSFDDQGTTLVRKSSFLLQCEMVRPRSSCEQGASSARSGCSGKTICLVDSCKLQYSKALPPMPRYSCRFFDPMDVIDQYTESDKSTRPDAQQLCTMTPHYPPVAGVAMRKKPRHALMH